MPTYWLTRTALLLALTLLCQSLRFVIPLPPMASILLIGSLVNACLLTTTRMTGLKSALIISCVAPVIAYFQNTLPHPLLIIPVAAGNAALVSVYLLFNPTRFWYAIPAAALTKTILLASSVGWLLTHFIKLPSHAADLMMLVMSWPQLITGVIGGIITHLIAGKLAKNGSNN